PRPGAASVRLPPGPTAVTGGTAELLADADRDGSWMLLVNGTPQSHVDLEDPSHLEFEYVRRMGHVLDLAAEPGAPLDVVPLGRGGRTVTRYLALTPRRPPGRRGPDAPPLPRGDPARPAAAGRQDRPAAHRPRPGTPPPSQERPHP